MTQFRHTPLRDLISDVLRRQYDVLIDDETMDDLARQTQRGDDAIRRQAAIGAWVEASWTGSFAAERYRQAALAAGQGRVPLSGAELIAIERQRQMDVEGWTPEHDDRHLKGALLEAAQCYADRAAVCAVEKRRRGDGVPFWLTGTPLSWPWAAEYWKPTDDPIRDLVKAGALIAAEIDRRRRLDETPSLTGGDAL